MPFVKDEHSSERARLAGKLSGEARRGKPKKLTLLKVEQELGALDTLDDCARWLRQLALWAAGGLLPGTVINGCVRSVEIRLRVFESKQTEEITASLRQRLDELEGQVKRTKLGVVS